MSHLLRRSLATVALLSILIFPHVGFAARPAHRDRPNFSGLWALDRRASTSIEPLMKYMGASYLQWKFANSANLRATYRQTPTVLTIAVRGAAVAMDETLHLDGRADRRSQEILGLTSLKIRTTWSNDHKELVETRQVKTKRGQGGQLVIRRHLTNEGKGMVVAFSLRLEEKPNTTTCRQVWQKQA